MTSRAGLRFLYGARGARPAWRKPLGRRYQSTDSTQAQAGFASRMWNSPIGVKTVHFWAPVMKWGLVIAGISDFSRPAEKLSLTQNLALTATGAIWTRWCFVIRPQNFLLAAVNFFLGCVGLTQVTRIFLYRRQLNEAGTTEELKNDANELGEKAVDTAKNPVSAVKDATK